MKKEKEKEWEMQEMQEIQELMSEWEHQLDKLHSIVADTIREEKLITKNLLHPHKESITFWQKISDKVARFWGSWRFIILFSIILAGWITYNALVISQYQFDPFPFILMNLILSTIAALQAPVIMMSQNRQEEKDRKRWENDYMINLKAELEIRKLSQKIDLLLEEQLKTLYESQGKQFVFLKEINKKLDVHLWKKKKK